VASVLNRLYDAMRHPSSAAVGKQSETVSGFEHLRAHKYCLLVTYRKNGAAVPTPVWFGMRDGVVYVRSEGDVAKVKRIRNDPRARVAPCTIRGRPLGPPADGRARILEKGSQEEHVAETALREHYGLERRIYERVAGTLTTSLIYIAITPA
jgi:PPOX class probable F420-dependent enzyme